MTSTATDLFIRHFSFWQQLSSAEKEQVNAATHLMRYPQGAHIHSGSLDCIGVLLVKKGQLRIYTLSEDGRDVTLYRVFPDEVEFLTASCLLEAVTFEVQIDAEEDTEVLLTDAAAFRHLMESNIHVRCFGYEQAAKRLSEMLWRMQQILFLSADRRLAIFLLDEMAQTGSATLHMTHEQIARYMGTAREVVSRLVKYFSQEGLISTARGCLQINNVAALQRLAGEQDS